DYLVGDGSRLTNIRLEGLTAALTVPQGGTGVTQLTPGGLLIGNGTLPIRSLPVMGVGTLLIGTGDGPPSINQLTQGPGVSIQSTSGNITIQHDDTSDALSLMLDDEEVLKAIDLDGFGHVTGWSKKTLSGYLKPVGNQTIQGELSITGLLQTDSLQVARQLTVNGTLTAGAFEGSGANLTDIPVTALSGVLPVSKGGTGLTSVPNQSLLMGSNSDSLQPLRASLPHQLLMANANKEPVFRTLRDTDIFRWDTSQEGVLMLRHGTSNASSVSPVSGVVVTGIDVDPYGHIRAISTTDYGVNFIKKTGDQTIDGLLSVGGGIYVSTASITHYMNVGKLSFDGIGGMIGIGRYPEVPLDVSGSVRVSGNAVIDGTVTVSTLNVNGLMTVGALVSNGAVLEGDDVMAVKGTMAVDHLKSRQVFNAGDMRVSGSVMVDQSVVVGGVLMVPVASINAATVTTLDATIVSVNRLLASSIVAASVTVSNQLTASQLLVTDALRVDGSVTINQLVVPGVATVNQLVVTQSLVVQGSASINYLVVQNAMLPPITQLVVTESFQVLRVATINQLVVSDSIRVNQMATLNQLAVLQGAVIPSLVVSMATVNQLLVTQDIVVSGVATLHDLQVPNFATMYRLTVSDNMLVTGVATINRLWVNEANFPTLDHLNVLNALLMGEGVIDQLTINQGLNVAGDATINQADITTATILKLTVPDTLLVEGVASIERLEATQATINRLDVNDLWVRRNALLTDVVVTRNLLVEGNATLNQLVVMQPVTLNTLWVTQSMMVDGMATLNKAFVSELTYDQLAVRNWQVWGRVTTNALVVTRSLVVEGVATINQLVVPGTATFYDVTVPQSLVVQQEASINRLAVQAVTANHLEATTVRVLDQATMTALIVTQSLIVEGTATLNRLMVPGRALIHDLIVTQSLVVEQDASVNRMTVQVATINQLDVLNLTIQNQEVTMNRLNVTTFLDVANLATIRSLVVDDVATINHLTVPTQLDVMGRASINRMVAQAATVNRLDVGTLRGLTLATMTDVVVTRSFVSEGLATLNRLVVPGMATINQLTVTQSLVV
ncbi:hypothetical protein EBZ35_06495, partial [bacterium]|nr:hypothetical protein [bacterium]